MITFDVDLRQPQPVRVRERRQVVFRRIPLGERCPHFEVGCEQPDRLVQPRAIGVVFPRAVTDARRAFHPRDLDELTRDQRPAQHAAERPAIIARRARAERRQQIVAREALAHVEHVRARRAGRQRAFADGVQFITLTEIERQRDDFDGPVRFAKQPIAQPGDRGHLGGAAGKG